MNWLRQHVHCNLLSCVGVALSQQLKDSALQHYVRATFQKSTGGIL